MKYKLTKNTELKRIKKFGIDLQIFPNMGNCGIVSVTTEEGHNQEFYNKKSTFNYIILEGSGSFFLDDEEVAVSNGDVLSINPSTRIYYKGRLKMILVTSPAFKAEDEVETKSVIWNI